jgi:hypothetical protein
MCDRGGCAARNGCSRGGAVDVVERAQWLRSFFAKMSRKRLGYVSCLFMLLPVTGAGWYDGDGILVGIGKIACETASAKGGNPSCPRSVSAIS